MGGDLYEALTGAQRHRTGQQGRKGTLMTATIRFGLAIVCATIALAGCAPAPLIYATVTCSSNKTHNIYVNYQENGCLAKANPVEPEYIDACPGDTVIWQARRGNTNSTDSFAILFSPLSRSSTPITAPRQTRTIWTDAPEAMYKYTVVGRTLRYCPNNSVDPRIKVDPR